MIANDPVNQCSCVRFASPVSVAVIVGLPVALALLLVIILAIVVIFRRRRRRDKPPAQTEMFEDNAETSFNFANKLNQDREHHMRPPDDYQKAGSGTDDNKRLPGDYVETGTDNEYSRQLPTVAALEDLDAEEKHYSSQLPDDYMIVDN